MYCLFQLVLEIHPDNLEWVNVTFALCTTMLIAIYFSILVISVLCVAK